MSGTAGRARWQLRRIAKQLREGCIVAYPTETVYGLGCDPWNREAVERLLEIKRRPADKGLILIAASLFQLAPFLGDVPAANLERATSTWPGPHTWLLPAADQVPVWIRGRHASVAVRVTSHPLAALLCLDFGGALVSTSANRQGEPPCLSQLQVRRRLGRRVDAILVGRTGPGHRPSTIRDSATGKLLRG
jgi:L-threonylcarbamoyladenylate synthase